MFGCFFFCWLVVWYNSSASGALARQAAFIQGVTQMKQDTGNEILLLKPIESN